MMALNHFASQVHLRAFSMKKCLVFTICLLSFAAHASQRAVTDEGDVVILNSNGTWEYESPRTSTKSEIKINNTEFRKNTDSTFAVKSIKNKSEFWIDPKEWSFKKSNNSNQAEYEFHLKGKDLYGMAITEGIEIGIENLAKVALANATEIDPDAKIINQEYRFVNGNKLMYMEMGVTIQGVNFIYFGCYYSDSFGTTQYLAYTSENLADQFRQDIEKFLNGFSIQK